MATAREVEDPTAVDEEEGSSVTEEAATMAAEISEIEAEARGKIEGTMRHLRWSVAVIV